MIQSEKINNIGIRFKLRNKSWKPECVLSKIQKLAWDRHKNVAGLNELMGYQPSPLPLMITGSPTVIHNK
jgi:hypothetical protein